MENQNNSYRWIVFGVVLFTYFMSVSQRTAPGLITDTLINEFTISASIMGIMASIQFLAYAGLQIPVGILSDRYGPNLFLILGTLLNGIGTLLYSLAPNEIVLLIARFLVGTGDSAIWINLILILSQWFKAKEFVGLLGIAGFSGSMGSLMASVPFSAWIELSGWRASFFTVGIILCVMAVLLYFVLILKPGQTIKNPLAVQKNRAKMGKNHEKTVKILLKIFSDRQAWATFLCHFGLVGTYIGFIGSWAVPYGLTVYGLTLPEASRLIMVGLIGAMIGSPLTSWIATHLYPIKRTYMAVHLMVFICWIIFYLFGGKPPVNVVIVLYFIIGYGSGASSLTFAIVRQSFDTKVVGVVTGFANTGGFISAILLPGIFGKILDRFNPEISYAGYHYGFLIPILFSMLGVVGGFLVKDQQKEVKHSIGAGSL